MVRNPLNDREKYYSGSEDSNSEWLRRFIIKHNCQKAKRVPDWELPRLRLIVDLLKKIEDSTDITVRALLDSVKGSEFSNKKTTAAEVQAEIARMESDAPALLKDFRTRFEFP